ncbi:hypothetical protein J2X20_002286 [Pelomonas saccharophila]|uniref:PEP-CTERM protein-sorting domain-containing protein n=1 Tax=Roseateles saccharophilus TaxID=304 RepID=A0ABU1YLC2_ROSSA|nr:PEP-CTERM sorting domain-containing protein [Roseateles saccharophilus]MDR7269657.1 hypothetical protein [Roseateles saccharophilus]
MKSLKKFAFAAALATAAASAAAAPLTLTYTKSALAGGLYGYDFRLTLDNHDGSWSAGQQWDWIIFGESGLSAPSLFDTNGSASGGLSWTTTSFAAPITTVTESSGGHNGPTLAVGANSVVLPGWSPATLGDFIGWSGTSTVNVTDGTMKWSALMAGGGAQPINLELANPQAAARLPEPAALALVAIALAGVGAARRRSSR